MPGMYDWQNNMGQMPAQGWAPGQGPQMGGTQAPQFGQQREGWQDYMTSQGWDGQQPLWQFAQSLREQGMKPRKDYRQSDFFPGYGSVFGGQGLGGLAGMFGGNPTPRPMQAQAPQGYDGSGINPGGMYGGLQGLAMARRPGQVIAR